MGKTEELKELVQDKLKQACTNVYYEHCYDLINYPQIVFHFSNTNKTDARDDISLEIDIWDKGTNSSIVENLADEVEDIFNEQNLPQEEILPTFYVESRGTIDDPDKEIRRRRVTVLVQNYEREVK